MMDDSIFEEHYGDQVNFHSYENCDIVETGSFYPVQKEKPLIERGVIKDFIDPKISVKGLEDIKKPSQFVKKLWK